MKLQNTFQSTKDQFQKLLTSRKTNPWRCDQTTLEMMCNFAASNNTSSLKLCRLVRAGKLCDCRQLPNEWLRKALCIQQKLCVAMAMRQWIANAFELCKIFVRASLAAFHFRWTFYERDWTLESSVDALNKQNVEWWSWIKRRVLCSARSKRVFEPDRCCANANNNAN